MPFNEVVPGLREGVEVAYQRPVRVAEYFSAPPVGDAPDIGERPSPVEFLD